MMFLLFFSNIDGIRKNLRNSLFRTKQGIKREQIENHLDCCQGFFCPGRSNSKLHISAIKVLQIIGEGAKMAEE